MNASLNRIAAMFLRYLYLLRSSWPRLLELFYWPSVQLILWGFISQFLAGHSSWVAQGAGILMAAVLLWDVLFRGQLGVSLAFFEELHARNLTQLFASPLRPWELVVALLGISLVRTLIGVGGAALLAIPLFDFSLFGLGWPLLALLANLLLFGWAIGLAVSALVLRQGMGAESLAWVAIFAIAPISGIYYPIATLPDWLQPLALSLPPAHVFEGLRALMIEQRIAWDHLALALGLNLVAIVLGSAAFLFAFERARGDGGLLNVGE